MDRLEALLKAKGIKVFLRIDQQQEARQAGLDMRPTQLLLFGNPQAGTPIMNAAPSVALDLPLKALAWEDERGTGLAELQQLRLFAAAASPE